MLGRMGGAASTQRGTSSAPDVPPGEPVDHEEIERQFDAIDLRPVERWLGGYAGTDGPGPAGPAGPDLGPTRIDASCSIGEVAFAVLRRQFAAFLAKEAGTRLGEDPEELHDMRVAARRLRAALSLFAHVLPVRAGRLRGELGWVAQALGAVRDVDVQLDQLRAWTAEAGGPDREALGSLIAILREQREEARTALLGTLDSPRYDRLTIGFGAMLRHGPLRTSPASRAPALAAAPELLMERYRRVRAAARRVARAGGVEDLHRLRIRCKRLRYALEFFDDVYDHRGRSVIRRLVTLQDLLGGIQDSNVAVARLRELATAGGASLSPATVFAMGQVAQRYAHRAEALRDRYPKRYRRFRGRRWRAFARMLKEGDG